MQFASARLLGLSRFGNAGDTQQTRRPAMGLSGLNVYLKNECDWPPSLNKTNNLIHGVGLYVMVSRVWTDTARPFII